MKTYNINSKGFYGEFGGAFIPEMLYPNIEELRNNYIKISSSKSFKIQFNNLLKEYVGTLLINNTEISINKTGTK